MKILSLQAVLGAGAEEFKRISDQEMQVFLSQNCDSGLKNCQIYIQI